MKLLHYNIHMWTDSDGNDNTAGVEKVIRSEEPDLVSLVEVDEPWAAPKTTAGIAERLGYSWVFVPAFEYRSEGGFGNAILSRHPIRSVQQWQLLSPRLYDGTEPSEPRSVLLVRLDIVGQAVTFGSTHLPRSDQRMWHEASNRLLDVVASIAEPWILCGDFNREPGPWHEGRNNVALVPPVPTYPTVGPSETIDYALTRDVKANVDVVDCTASDHLPIVITTTSLGSE